MNMIIGNRCPLPITRIMIYELMFDSGVKVDLVNCCYSFDMTRNIISFHAFLDKDFITHLTMTMIQFWFIRMMFLFSKLILVTACVKLLCV